MTSAGILVFFIIYGLIFLTGLFCGWKSFTSKKYWQKLLLIMISLCCFAFIGLTLFTHKRNLQQKEQQFVGTYFLTRYPNCDSCEAILKEDKSFTVMSYNTRDKNKVFEHGYWHYVAEGDFLCVYMDNEENELLGYNRFDYSYYLNRQNKMIKAPETGP